MVSALAVFRVKTDTSELACILTLTSPATGRGTGQHQMWKRHFYGLLADSCNCTVYSWEAKAEERKTSVFFALVLSSSVINLRRAIDVHSWGCTVQYKLYVSVVFSAWSCMGRIAYPTCCFTSPTNSSVTRHEMLLNPYYTQKEEVWGCFSVAFIHSDTTSWAFFDLKSATSVWISNWV